MSSVSSSSSPSPPSASLCPLPLLPLPSSPLTQWTIEEVTNALKTWGINDATANKFTKEEITGKTLFNVTRDWNHPAWVDGITKGTKDKIIEKVNDVLLSPSPPVPDSRLSELKSLNDSLPVPSSYSKPQKWSNEKKNNQNKMQFHLLHHHRPASQMSFPLTLIHPIFGRFVDRLSSSESIVEREDCQFAVNLCNEMSKSFESEQHRNVVFTRELNDYLRHPFHSRRLDVPIETADRSTNVVTDGSIVMSLPQIPGVDALLLNREDKHEKGAGGGDAYLENAAYYAHWYGRKDQQSLVESSCCPSFLLELVGPAICVSGAAFQEFISIDPLTPMYYLFFLPRNPLMMKIAQVFKALKLGIQELKEYYEQIEPLKSSSSSPSSTPPSLCFPYPCSFSPPHSEKSFHFSYVKKLLNSNDRCFEGKITKIIERKTNDFKSEDSTSQWNFNSPPSVGDSVIIKFTRRYGTDGHLLLSQRNPPLAPLLYSVSSLPGGWLMIVMKKLQDSRPLDNRFLSLSSQDSSISSRVVSQLKESVSLLRENHFVHGDFRESNILIDSQYNVFLIDFDWCGKEDKDVYPHFMNGVDIKWPKGVSDGLPMKTSHDEEMLHRILNLFMGSDQIQEEKLNGGDK